MADDIATVRRVGLHRAYALIRDPEAYRAFARLTPEHRALWEQQAEERGGPEGEGACGSGRRGGGRESGHIGYSRRPDRAETPQMNAKEMAATFGVSERTARRHIARGTTPDARRKVGRDGKTYAGSHASYHHGRRSRPYTPLSRDLEMARNAVRRLARATAFSPDDDLPELRTIAIEAAALLQAWTIAVEAEQHERLRAGPWPASSPTRTLQAPVEEAEGGRNRSDSSVVFILCVAS